MKDMDNGDTYYDSREFETLYKSYYPNLSAYASLFLDSMEVHDVVQEVFLSLLENDREIKYSTMKAYLYKAVHNKCIDYIRLQYKKNQYASEAGKKLLEKESEYFISSINEIEKIFYSKELQERVDKIVNKLPARKKEIFELYFQKQLSSKEIGRMLSISDRTVESHIYEIIKVLKDKLGKLSFLLFIISANY